MILHICRTGDWTPGAAYRPESLDTVGFVHCADPGTVHLPADRLFRGQPDLLLLCVDPARLTVPVRWEEGDPPDPGGVRFPHVYGPIDPEAVVSAHPFPPAADGTFHLPPELAATHS
ncbi:MAG TPA: DUF952 domain-containing protein [Actinophytocola sp.]|nr:DUF952 domain-containing protein [Actinophytocola sp.]